MRATSNPQHTPNPRLAMATYLEQPPYDRYVYDGRVHFGATQIRYNNLSGEEDVYVVRVMVPMAIGVLISRSARRARGFTLYDVTENALIVDLTGQAANFGIQISPEWESSALVPHIDTRGIAIGIPVHVGNVRVFSRDESA